MYGSHDGERHDMCADTSTNDPSFLALVLSIVVLKGHVSTVPLLHTVSRSRLDNLADTSELSWEA